MSAERVQPLRISKASPLKGHGNSPSPRPLVEIGPMERRRNSPSWNQATKKMIVSRDSSPFDSSGLNPQKTLWQGKLSSSPFNENGYDRPDSPSLVRHRASIENLKKVSRVKNSSMFAREHLSEYDPTSPVVVERPLASGRPLSLQPAPHDAQPSSLDEHVTSRGHRRGESQSQIPIMQPAGNAKPEVEKRNTPSPTVRNPQSPTKSSFAAKSGNTFPRNFDLSSAHLSEDDDDNKASPPRQLRRQAKSVTFDAAPPQINEYEMATPDPSSVADSREGSYDDYYDEEGDGVYDMDRAMDDSFDASLEDTDKTPVVLPEDWRAMSPEVADTSLAANFEDPFNSQNAETPTKQWNPYRAASHDSDSDSRPLPPVPMFAENHNRRNSGSILERVHNTRSLPVPPAAASISKSDLLNMKKDGPVTIEDRLKLMGIRDSQSPDLVEREKARLQRHGLGIHVYEDEPEKAEKTKLPDFSFPRISRESILKKVRSQAFDHAGDEPNADSFPRQYDVQNLDPDVPIPSREVSSDDVPIKQEPMDDLVDLYAIPAMYAAHESAAPDNEGDGSVVRLRSESKTDESFYSTTGGVEVSDQSDTDTLRQEEEIHTSTPLLDATKDVEGVGAGLPEFSALIDESEFPSSLHSYLSNVSDDVAKDTSIQNDSLFSKSTNSAYQPAREVVTDTKMDGLEDPEDVPGTPDSIIHQPLGDLASPTVPDSIATVKAPGMALKTRPSATPANIETMAATRRKVSGTMPPPVPEKSPKRLSLTQPIDISTDAFEKDSIDKAIAAHKKRRESFRIRLDIGDEAVGEDLSLDMDKEFNRVIETSKKGYLMRQNTKVVVAKRNFSNERSSNESDRPASADNILAPSNASPRKPSHERAKSWTTEPWNGKMRRRSIRTSDKRLSTGPAPPLPGQESVTSGLDTVPEDQYFQTGDAENGVERGRLFVKVVGVKDVDLPLPNHERTWFQLTLDNGLHCVTTSRLELGRSAPIGQEFELVVLNDLEFQLTLQALVEPPAKVASPQPTPQKPKSPVKKSTFSRFLSTPKKRREQDRLLQQQKEEEERKAKERKAQEAARRAAQPQSAWELFHDLIGDEGSFGRAYVNLKNHEDACFGRPITVDIPLFNEWAIEDPQFSSSVKSKRGHTLHRRPPYQIGNLTLQLLYVPRPKGVADEEMPKSMNGCVREMAAAESSRNTEFEGFLSQQGGDCPYWRRRFFRLSGLNLIAFHETTRQPRTKISLARATKIIDDKTTLLKPDGAHGKGGKGRRRSAFADEDQAYMFVEEGFRMRFANGEAIDFYADSTAEKNDWMRALACVIGKDGGAGGAAGGATGWCDAVLRRERTLKERADALAKPRPRSQGQAERPPVAHTTQSTPSSPVKGARFAAGGPIEPMGRLGEVGKRPPGRLSAKRHQIKSMIF